MEISNDLIKQAAIVALAGIVGAGGGFGSGHLQERGHDAAVSDLRQEVSDLRGDMRVLRAQLQFYTTGTVNFMGAVAPPPVTYELESVGEAVEDVAPPSD